MRLVIADTGPVNYLILIGQIELLPRLCVKVVLPSAVLAELSSPGAPAAVQRWVAAPPAWLEIANSSDLVSDRGLHRGEAEAIALALSLRADLLLMDDRRGVLAAEQRGLTVTGTLGILDIAADRGMIDFPQAIRELETTNFRRPAAILELLLEKHKKAAGS